MRTDEPMYRAFGEGPDANHLLKQARLAREARLAAARALHGQASYHLESMVEVLTRKLRESEQRVKQGRQLRVGGVVAGAGALLIFVLFRLVQSNYLGGGVLVLTPHLEYGLILTGSILWVGGFMSLLLGYSRGVLDGW